MVAAQRPVALQHTKLILMMHAGTTLPLSLSNQYNQIARLTIRFSLQREPVAAANLTHKIR